MEKLNMTIGRFQPFTQGHLNMINEGDGPCIVYRINSSGKMPETLKGFKVGGRVIKADSVKTVANYIDNPEGDLSTQEKELLKRPFTNELIEKELEIVKKNNKNIIDVIPVINMFDALIQFNKFMTDNADQYEPQFLMCGDDRADAYAENIDKYDELDDAWQSGKKIPNLLKGKLKVNIGKGRTEGVSGTDVRKAILNKDKSAFEKIMPKGVGKMFDEFVEAFDKFKGQLQGLIKENKEFKNYINNNMKSLNNYLNESYEIINEGKSFTLQDCKGWKFSFIGIKDRWGLPGDPKMKFSLVCTPDDKTKDIVVFRNFAKYHGGYDQGHASSRKFYLDTITAGSRGNGHGQDKEYEPRDYDLELDAEHLDCYLNGKKDWSKQASEALEKAAQTYDRKTKISQIKNDLS